VSRRAGLHSGILRLSKLIGAADMKAGLITVVFLVTAAGLAGCGQKGPLYLPSADQTGAEKTTIPEKDADHENAGDQ
jgi:predicted small lipoprotein YifL